jgi:hypothetical protein
MESERARRPGDQASSQRLAGIAVEA